MLPTVSSVVVVSRGQVSADLHGETAILHVASGTYYGLDPVGARIWSLIREPRSVSEVRDALVEEYDVNPERCERDLLTLLGELASAGLVEVRDGPAG